MLNNIVIAGRLVREPEVRIVGSGVTVCDFSVAVDRDFKNDGEKVTDFFDCTAWRSTAEFLVKYIRKGDMLVVKGSMLTKKWKDKETGANRSKMYLDAQNIYPVSPKKKEDSFVINPATTDSSNPAPVYSQEAFSMLTDDDAQLPF